MTWTDGPTQGLTHDHVFHEDGTVEWYDAASASGEKTGGGGSRTGGAKDRPPYAAVEVSEGVYVVSYLSASGYTLTAVLNFDDKRIVGFASSSKDWHPVRGRFEIVS